jgi:hypothetical protein
VRRQDCGEKKQRPVAGRRIHRSRRIMRLEEREKERKTASDPHEGSRVKSPGFDCFSPDQREIGRIQEDCRCADHASAEIACPWGLYAQMRLPYFNKRVRYVRLSAAKVKIYVRFMLIPSCSLHRVVEESMGRPQKGDSKIATIFGQVRTSLLHPAQNSTCGGDQSIRGGSSLVM